MNRKKQVKCLVWDLDNTLWNGVLLEDKTVRLRKDAVKVLQALDKRGILQSIASMNDYDIAMAKIESLGLGEYFLYPQICWGPKADSIKEIASHLNIGTDSIAFIDDQSFEREAVNFYMPEVLCIDANMVKKILDMLEMNPRFITSDSGKRRLMYIADMKRNRREASFHGSQEEFLETLGMVMSIAPAQEDDLKRAEELTERTNQLNATGYTYSYEELNQFRISGQHLLLIAELEDKFGTYGKIGLALIETGNSLWNIKLLLMSCRVMSRGVGTVILAHIVSEAKKNNVRLLAEFVPNNRNRMMDITYRFANFIEYKKKGGVEILENDLTSMISFPEYLELIIK